MKLGFVIPIVGPAISGAPGLTAFCRGRRMTCENGSLWLDRPSASTITRH